MSKPSHDITLVSEIRTYKLKMTPEEFRDKMIEIFKEPWKRSLTTEDTHEEADNLIIELLKELGYGEGAAVFEGEDKWYA